MRRFVSFGPAFVVLVTVLVTLIAAPTAVKRIGHATTEVRVRAAQNILDEENILEQINRAVRAVAEAVEPTVVHIAVQRRSRPGQGSGWAFDDQGHIITNSHVVEGATRITVQFYDGTSVRARLVGQDRSTDIAVLQVETDDLFPARRATGDELRQGDRVYAFGSPFGFKFSMSEGIVSGLGRDPRAVISQDGYTNYIQFDAAVNPGNSGGPLVDVTGRVVGMNVAIATAPGGSGGPDQGQSAGISFAIPLATIEAVAQQLIDNGEVRKGFLGIRHESNDDANRQRVQGLGYRGRGVAITDVVPDGPAAEAGLMADDIIIELAGRNVLNLASLRSTITNHRPGDDLAVGVWRNEQLVELVVRLERLVTTDELLDARRELQNLGIAEVVETRQGVAVSIVDPGTPATAVGLVGGDLVVSVEGRDVTDAQSLYTLLVQEGLLDGSSVRVMIRDAAGRERAVVLDP